MPMIKNPWAEALGNEMTKAWRKAYATTKAILVWGGIEPEFAKLGISAENTYKASPDRNGYMTIPSVYELADEDFERLEAIPEEDWNQAVAWRYAEGSNMGPPDRRVIVNGRHMQGWHGHSHWPGRRYDDLLQYMCDEIGASQPRNVTALAVDLARANNLALGQLFAKYQPTKTP